MPNQSDSPKVNRGVVINAFSSSLRYAHVQAVSKREGRGVAPSEARPADLSSMLTWSAFDRLTCVPPRCARGPAE
jgi:hypothetical protein